MIELHNDELIFAFPELETQLKAHTHIWIDGHIAEATDDEKGRLPSSRPELYAKFAWCIPRVRASVSLQRTLRIPDDGKDYPLPPGLGRFPVRHVDDFAGVPDQWRKHGGVMVPMHKTEALWLNFSANYPMALKVGAGQICAVSGKRWSAELQQTPQNYVVLPGQPWLDGFRVTDNIIRQFIAVPLGHGMTVEHQLTKQETWGGLQLKAFPLCLGVYGREQMESKLARTWKTLTCPTPPDASFQEHGIRRERSRPDRVAYSIVEEGLGAGGRMKQEIKADTYGVEAWDASLTSRCFVHLCAADDWQRLTGTPPPHAPPTATDYTKAGLPWFDYEEGKPAVAGSTALTDIKSVNTLLGEKTGLELPDNETIVASNILKLKIPKNAEVREF